MVALALITAAGPAAAQGPVTAPMVAPAEAEVVVVLPMTGGLDDHVARPIEARVAAGLRGGSLTVVSAEAVRAGGVQGECGAECLQRVGRDAKARYLVRIEAAVAGRDYAVRLVLLRADTGEPTVVSRELCEICGHEELADRVGDMASALRRTLGSAVEPLPRLRVLTRPDGSAVRVDGAVVGVTPLDIVVTPGEHEVRVEHAGFVAHRRRMTFPEGITRTVATELGPVAPPPVAIEEPRARRRLTPLGGTSLALGLAATGGGLAMVVIHERPIARDCVGANVDAMGDCKWRHDTLAGGVALGLVGVAAVTLGAVLLVLERRRGRRSPARAAVMVAPSGLGFRF